VQSMLVVYYYAIADEFVHYSVCVQVLILMLLSLHCMTLHSSTACVCDGSFR
jgi:hypothetical protein